MAAKRNLGREKILAPLAYDPAYYVDLTGATDSTPLPETPPSNGVGKSSEVYRAHLRQTLTDETNTLAQKFTFEYWENGAVLPDIEMLIGAYAKREPTEKSELLTALGMEPRHMAHLFTIARHAPDLPKDDPVYQASCTADKSAEERKIEQNRMLNLSMIEADRTTWPKIVSKCFTKGIETLGELADADPNELLTLRGIGEKQLQLCAQMLKAHDLLTDRWRAMLEI
ncbi:MAG TPA: helix-hairpin-helix domain-containing protein [Candidatus Peribacterales bacterium]|nr:helix-hairpin-helix domain-containing protein [Candidatus Peribacterales bacterium]